MGALGYAVARGILGDVRAEIAFLLLNHNLRRF
jgi:hypothetical protein